MTRFIHRTLLIGLAALAVFPIGLAQQAKGNDQPDGTKQGRRGAMMRQRQHMNELAQKLGLTEAQKQQFMEIGRDTRKQGMAIRQDSSLNDDQKKEKIQALRKQQHQQMFSVLTPEQKEKLKAMHEEHKNQQDDKSKKPGDQASAKNAGSASNDDDDPFAGMTSDDDGPGNGGF